MSKELDDLYQNAVSVNDSVLKLAQDIDALKKKAEKIKAKEKFIPTEPGLYWYKGSPTSTARVVRFDGHKANIVFGSGSRSPGYTIDEWRGEWLGPASVVPWKGGENE